MNHKHLVSKLQSRKKSKEVGSVRNRGKKRVQRPQGRFTTSSTAVGICACLLFFGLCLYSYLDMQNALTGLRIEVPKLARSLREIQEENIRLQYAIEEYENPQHMMQLAREEGSKLLQFPLLKEVITLKQGLAISDLSRQKLDPPPANARVALASSRP